MPTVTIIIPTRNRADLLRRAVESARHAGTDVEIVVIDDASEDNTAEVCAGFTEVRCIRLRHQLGVGGARNVGIIASKSPYISFLDDDDLRLPGSINAQLKLLKARPDAGMIYGRALYGDEEARTNGEYYPVHCPQEDLFWGLMTRNFIPCPTVVFRRECLTRVGLLDQEAIGIEDWDLWVRIAELYPVLAMDQTAAIWRRSTSTSRQLTSRPERLHQHSRRLHQQKWMKLPRATDADERKRREATQAFERIAAQQLIWESASRFKARRSRDFMRLGFATARMYPGAVIKTAFETKTWRSISKLGQAVDH